MAPRSNLPRVLFVNINGAGMGHLSRCLAYARRMDGRARPVFLSMASAVEIIRDMGFEADYFVSNMSSCSEIMVWNRELAVRLGLLLEEIQPDVLVFDGTWPFDALLRISKAWGGPRKVWSNRGLHREGAIHVPVEETEFDLVIEPGEVGTTFCVTRAQYPGRKVVLPPVTLLDDDELLDRAEARARLGLAAAGRYALLSLGAGNVKDIGGIGRGLIELLWKHGFSVAWAQPPISLCDVPLPPDVMPLALYPLVRYVRAFDVFVGAAGYNTCCEVLQSRVPSLLVPNIVQVDDQVLRAEMVAQHAPVVVSACETADQRAAAVSRLLALTPEAPAGAPPLDLSGARRAVEEILTLVGHVPSPAKASMRR